MIVEMNIISTNNRFLEICECMVIEHNIYALLLNILLRMFDDIKT